MCRKMHAHRPILHGFTTCLNVNILNSMFCSCCGFVVLWQWTLHLPHFLHFSGYTCICEHCFMCGAQCSRQYDSHLKMCRWSLQYTFRWYSVNKKNVQGLQVYFLTCPPFCVFSCSNMANALANAMCERCRSGFAPAEKIVNSNGELYHEQCFVCAQCFQQFPEGLFYEVRCLHWCSWPKFTFLDWLSYFLLLGMAQHLNHGCHCETALCTCYNPSVKLSWRRIRRGQYSHWNRIGIAPKHFAVLGNMVPLQQP